MHGDVDLDAGTIATGEESLEEVGRRIYDAVLDVACGRLASAEARGHREFALSRIFARRRAA